MTGRFMQPSISWFFVFGHLTFWMPAVFMLPFPVMVLIVSHWHKITDEVGEPISFARKIPVLPPFPPIIPNDGVKAMLFHESANVLASLNPPRNYSAIAIRHLPSYNDRMVLMALSCD